FTAPARTAEWRLGAGAGRRYADVSGDWNPIHLTGVSARLFGMKGAIAHGMLLAARMLQGREPAAGGFRWEIEFDAPVVLPGTVAVRYEPADGQGTRVIGWDGRRGRRHFTGRIAPRADCADDAARHRPPGRSVPGACAVLVLCRARPGGA
ncbi:MAG: hypothetical protein L0G62_04500, partial [Micrococcaceae bacterium]|nr:hypothetical protein [Micrococcaceae bacterium]